MRLLLITGSYPPDRCGVGDYTEKLASALAELPSMTVGILTGGDGARHMQGNIEIIHGAGTWRLRDAGTILAAVKAWRPDIAHIQTPTQGYGRSLAPWLLPALLYLAGIRIVETWHERFSLFRAPMLIPRAVASGGAIVVRPNYWDELHPLLRWIRMRRKTVYIESASTIPAAQLTSEGKAAIREHYLGSRKRLLVFFGFLYPSKGVEQIFEIADPATDRIVLAGQYDPSDSYYSEIMELAESGPWAGGVLSEGFLPAEEVANLLCIADAVVLPFRGGGGDWNTSIHAAVLNRSFVLTTSWKRSGYDNRLNVYFARPNDVVEMTFALEKYAGVKRTLTEDVTVSPWHTIAERHRDFYVSLIDG